MAKQVGLQIVGNETFLYGASFIHEYRNMDVERAKLFLICYNKNPVSVKLEYDVSAFETFDVHATTLYTDLRTWKECMNRVRIMDITRLRIPEYIKSKDLVELTRLVVEKYPNLQYVFTYSDPTSDTLGDMVKAAPNLIGINTCFYYLHDICDAINILIKIRGQALHVFELLNDADLRTVAYDTPDTETLRLEAAYHGIVVYHTQRLVKTFDIELIDIAECVCEARRAAFYMVKHPTIFKKDGDHAIMMRVMRFIMG